MVSIPRRERALVATEDTLRGWRSGPRWYAVVAAMIDDVRVERRREQVLAQLGGWLRPSAPGQAHVTLAALGFDEAAAPVGVDEAGAPVGAADNGLSADLAAGSPRLEPFDLSVRIGGVGLFASAVYLLVDDADGSLTRARARFRTTDRDRAEPWLPHVTAGVFTDPVPLRDVRTRLAGLPPMPPLKVTARLQLMAVDTRSPAGAMTPVERLDAVTGPASDSRTLRRGGFA